MKRKNLDIIMAGVRSCTGSCVYCASANQKDMWRGSLVESTSIKSSEEVQFDFDALEKKMLEHMGQNKYWEVHIWGADPLSSFYALSDTVDFIEWFAEKHGYDIQIDTSTNGAPLISDEVTQYLIDHNIYLQLSHDGVAEELRLPYDPLMEYKDNFKRLPYVYLNCVAHYYNCDFQKNIDYFKQFDFLGEKRFSKPMIGANTSNAINTKGFRNGNYYEHLKGTPFGDFGIRNTEDDPHLIQEYIRWAFTILPHTPGWRFNIGVHNAIIYNSHEPGCGAFAKGIKDYSFHIDTLGNYTTCNLADSMGFLGNPNIKPQFKECSKCRYKYSQVCSGCALNPTEDTIHDKCEFNYALNVALELSKTNAQKTNNIEKRKQ